MVLPAPPPDDQPREGAWLDAIRLELSLASRGILILVDKARPERLRDLVLALLPSYPDLEVYTDVQAVYEVPEGATMVLAPRAEDADFLNINRPVFARRGLKVVLWCDEATTLALARNAVDFFDWISRRHECPPGVPMHAGAQPRALHALAMILARRGQFEEAERHLRRALSIEQSLGTATTAQSLRLLDDLADVLTHQGRYREAEEIVLQEIGELRRLDPSPLLEQAEQRLAHLRELITRSGGGAATA